MKKLLSAFALAVSCTAMLPAEAQANPQHERMRRCSQEAKEQTLKGDERKAFMSTCLKGKHDAGAETAAAPAKPAAKAAAAKPAAEKSAADKTTAAKPAAADKVAEADAAPVAQRSKMKTCNQSATEQSLKGDARKAFMSECLKG